MKIIKPDVEFITPINGATILKRLEQCGRVCYKSEAKITDTSAPAFVAGIIKRGHEAVLEHCSFAVKFICDRGVSHEIVRHRMASYCQESTRYCNYSKDGFGPKRLKRAWELFYSESQKLREYYLLDEGDEPWIARQKLKEIGCDVEAWYQEWRETNAQTLAK